MHVYSTTNVTLCHSTVIDDVDYNHIINETETDMVCLPSINYSNNSGKDAAVLMMLILSLILQYLSYIDVLTCEQSCISPMEVDNIVVLITVQSTADVGHSFTLNCTIVGINDSDSLLITYQWYKDQQLLQNARAPTLFLSALTLLDIGGYVCEASIKSSSQGHGIIRSSSPYRISVSSEYSCPIAR